MMKCSVCDSDRSKYVLNNKTVCFRCDELLFDIEIEEDAEPVRAPVLHRDMATTDQRPKTIPLTVIKK